MKLRFLLIALAGLLASGSFAQKLSTRNGYIRFFSETPVENIEAENRQVSSVIDMANGSFAFLVQIKAFQFEKALMQEHFNENYMESGEYPNAKFQGTIEGYEEVNLNKDGEYKVNFSGTMTIHGTSREINESATLVVQGDKINLKSKFQLKPEDYDVKIPASKRDNISETLDITVKMDYDKK